MNKPLCASALALAVALAAVPAAQAEPDKVQYELQERCGKLAAETFKSDYPEHDGGSSIESNKNGQRITTYNAHYSSLLNKCFYLRMVTIININKPPPGMSTTYTLFDINENKKYGNFFKRSEDGAPVVCKIKQAMCRSENEWQEMLKPYMEQ